MKKIANYSIIIYLVLFGALLVIGPYIFDVINQYGGGEVEDFVYNNRILYLILAIIVSIIASTAIYEIGHVIGAKIGKYKVYSFNLFNVLFYKKNGKIKIGFESMDGFSGETKVTPLKSEANPKIFYSIGIILSFVLVILALLPGLIFTTSVPSWIRVGLDVFAVTLGCVVIYNVVPLHFDTTTDGYMRSLFAKKENVEAFNQLCKYKYDLLQGNPTDEVPIYEKVNYITSQVNMLNVFELIYQHQFAEALELIDRLAVDSDKCYEKVWENLASQKIFLFFQIKSLEETKEEYYEKMNAKDRKMIFENKTLEGERAIMLISSCIEESESEVKISLKRYFEHLKKERNDFKVQKENILLEDTLRQIKELHPDWKLEMSEE